MWVAETGAGLEPAPPGFQTQRLKPFAHPVSPPTLDGKPPTRKPCPVIHSLKLSCVRRPGHIPHPPATASDNVPE